MILGYSGSDGTIAWAWPERDLMILYFTQSRGTRTGLEVEEVLGELPDIFRCVLVMREFDGMAYQAIADTLGWIMVENGEIVGIIGYKGLA